MSGEALAAPPAAAAPPAGGDLCPRCGGGFHCGVADAAPCPCTRVALDAATLARLRQRFAGCLCPRCLGDLAAGAPP